MKKTTILICDDESGVRDSLKLILDSEYELLYATNGQELLEMLRDKKIDPALVIMDVKMPRLGGLETLPHIKKLRPRIRVLIATGYESSDVASQAINLGADDYLVKPFDRFQVRSKVVSLVGPASTP